MQGSAAASAVAVAKAAVRREVVARRAALTAAQHAAAAERLAEAVLAQRPRRVAAYVSVGSEPGTRSLLEGLEDVLLPVVLPDGDLDWARYDGALVQGPGGVPEPAGPPLGCGALAGCDVVVVPGLAVDREGFRLGRGGGSYDRALVRATGLTVVALHDGELVETLPREPHDQPVQAVVTPAEGLVRL